MLEIVKIYVWNHRPPNLKHWKVEYKRDGRKLVRYVFAEDEMEAYADTIRWARWQEETFGNSDSQNTGSR